MEYTKEVGKSDKPTLSILLNPRVAKLCTSPIGRKMSGALEYAADTSIYSREVTIGELTTAQSMVLTFLYSLITEDVGLTAFIAKESRRVEQIASTHLKVWIKDDFSFAKKDLVRGMTFMRKIQDNGSLHIPQHLTEILAPLRTKYDVRVRRNGITRMPSCIALSPKRKGTSINKINDYEEEHSKNREKEHKKSDKKLSKVMDEGNHRTSGVMSNINIIEAQYKAVVSAGYFRKGISIREISWVLFLQKAVESNTSPVRSLIDAGVDMLHIAITNGSLESLKFLYRAGANINISNIAGFSPLVYAFRKNSVPAIHQLVAAGVSENGTTRAGENPLRATESVSNTEPVDALVNLRADLELENRLDSVPLYISSSTHIIDQLAIRGAEVYSRSDIGKTALHMAALRECMAAMETLVGLKGTVKANNINEERAIAAIVRYNNPAVVDLLCALGANH